MKKKLVVWILTVSLTATNGCLVCAQEPVPDIPSEVQEYITNEADTKEDTETSPLEKDITESPAEDGTDTQEDKNEPESTYSRINSIRRSQYGRNHTKEF